MRCVGEMVVGQKRVLFAVSAAAWPDMSARCKLAGDAAPCTRGSHVAAQDEISTGLDSSTTYQIVRSTRNFAHILEVTPLNTWARCVMRR